MILLHRYILWSVLLTALVAVALFAFVLILGNALRDVIGLVADGQLALGLFIRLLLLLVPYVVAYALPLGILAGVLLVLGRMSARGEITAMRSAGLSLPRITAPIFLLALAGVAFAVMVNFYYAPLARTRYRQDLADAIRHNPLDFIVENTFVRSFPGYILYVGDKNGEQLDDIWVWELDEERRVSRFVRAERGSFDYDPATESLILNLHGGFFEARGRDPEALREWRPGISLDHVALRLPLEGILGRRTVNRKLSMMTFYEVMAERERLRKQGELDAEFDARSAIMRVQMSVQERFSMAWSILSLAMIAVPLGITIQRKETSANMGLALALGLSFYFLIIAVGWLERLPHLRPDLLMWAPNILFQGLGIWLFIRAERR